MENGLASLPGPIPITVDAVVLIFPISLIEEESRLRHTSKGRPYLQSEKGLRLKQVFGSNGVGS